MCRRTKQRFCLILDQSIVDFNCQADTLSLFLSPTVSLSVFPGINMEPYAVRQQSLPTFLHHKTLADPPEKSTSTTNAHRILMHVQRSMAAARMHLLELEMGGGLGSYCELSVAAVGKV